MYVTFDNVSSTSLGLILISKTIYAPSVKTALVSIDGSDGSLDMTEYFGKIRYNNRKIEIKFTSLNPGIDVWSNVQKALHGKKCNIVFSEDPNYYYIGRISLNSWQREKSTASFTMTIDSEPYKYKTNETTVTSANNTTKVYTNLQKPAVPEFTLAGTTKITFGSYSTQLTAGTYIIPAIEFSAGSNSVAYEGSGNITVKYQEGCL